MTKANRRVWGIVVGRGADARRWLFAAACLSCLLGSGCASLPWSKKDAVAGIDGSGDTFVMRGKGIEKNYGALSPELQQDLDAAHRLYLEREYGKAEETFAKILKYKKLPVNVAEEALFHEGECQYQSKNYRRAQGTFSKHLRNYRNGQHAQESIQRLFQIADYWLEDTRAEMKARTEDGKSWFVLPATWHVNLAQDMPILDAEGHALVALEDVRLNDIGGKYGEQACFYIATVKFFREKYSDADFYFSELFTHYPNSELAPKAIKQSIICKQIMTGGSAYDSRSVEETRKLLDVAPAAYPSIAHKEGDWLERQLKSVNLQQADRDFNIAEFYRRTGHPGSAYFYYELVRRCYPGTPQAGKAVERMNELRSKVETEAGPGPVVGGPFTAPSAPAGVAPPPGEPRVLPPSLAPPAP